MQEACYLLKRMREALKLSQRYVAGRVGVSRQIFNQWEMQRSIPSAEHYFKWRDTLLTEVQRIKGEKGEANHNSVSGGEL